MNKKTSLSPRIRLCCEVIPGTDLNMAWGYYYQMPDFMKIDNNTFDFSHTRFEKAEHFIIGTETKIGEYVFFSPEIYFKRYTDIIPAERLSSGEINYIFDDKYASGSAYGADVRFEYSHNYFSIFLNYGYLIAKEREDNRNSPPNFRYTDQRHTFSGNIFYKAGRWDAGINVFFGSGLAYTPSVTSMDTVNHIHIWEKGNRNSSHLPSYLRADLRISRRFLLFEQQFIVYLNIMNVFNRRNVYGYRYSYQGKDCTAVSEELRLLPLVPSIGIRYEIF